MKLANQIYITARVDSRTPEETHYFGRKSRYPRITSNCSVLLCIPIRNREYGKRLSVEPCKRGPSPTIKDLWSHRFCLFRMCASLHMHSQPNLSSDIFNLDLKLFCDGIAPHLCDILFQSILEILPMFRAGSLFLKLVDIEKVGLCVCTPGIRNHMFHQRDLLGRVDGMGTCGRTRTGSGPSPSNYWIFRWT